MKWIRYVLVRMKARYTDKTVVSFWGSSYVVAGNVVKRLGTNRRKHRCF